MEFQILIKLIPVLTSIMLASALDEYLKLENEYVKHFGKSRVTVKAKDTLQKYPPVKEETKIFAMRVLEGSPTLDDPQNPTGQWPEAKSMAASESLAEFVSRTHFLNERTSYENILEAYVQNGTLHFIKTNVTYKPMHITVVNYTSHKERLDYYITKGMQGDCLFYLNPLDEKKSTFHLTQHKCDCIFF